MTDPLDTPTPESVSRRNVLLGLGAVAGAAAGAGLLTSQTFATSAPARLSLPSAVPHAEVLGAQIPGLTYIAIDAQQFMTAIPSQRLYQDMTGAQPVGASDNRIWAGLPIPAGSIVAQINVAYQGQPTIEITRRKLTTTGSPLAPPQAFSKQVSASPGGVVSTTVNLPTPLTIESDSSYTVSAECSIPGTSIYAVQIGYLPPTQGFIPFTGTTPRVFDSRLTANGPKFTINTERVVDLGVAGARTAILNLTVTQTEGAGFVAIYPNDISNPGNSSINWSAANQDIANGVITRVDAGGKIKVFSSAGTHVVIDRIGTMI
ncbi:MAG: hypothetical protein JWM34_40 [Ilumatobacteraceae bacterium]|nr:hypothetical protein [Ilumatobacteraceae bacterium]